MELPPPAPSVGEVPEDDETAPYDHSGDIFLDGDETVDFEGDGGALTTARQNLRTQYAFVGALERQRESLCVLSALLGVATPKASGDRLKGPTTHTKGDVPEDFREAFAAYVAQDDQLYAEALELLDAHVEAFPRCKS